MSIGLHLRAFDRDGVMPSLSRPKAEISFASRAASIDSRHSSNNVYKVKDFSIIDHIESLKAAARNELVFSGDITNGCHDTSLPSLFQEDKSSSISSYESCIDRASVEGNLRTSSNQREEPASHDGVASRVSSFEKEIEVLEEEKQGKTLSIKKPDKCTKKRLVRKKESRLNIHSEKDFKKLTNSSDYSDLKKQCKPTNESPSNDLSVLTALCKSITIHRKNASTISVKEAPYVKRSSVVDRNIHRKSVSSPARTSLSNAVIEYSKKKTSGADHKRNHNTCSVDVTKTKIFLSEKQSGIISDSGNSFPCAPPVTPTADHLNKTEYVPSLQDIRAQRNIRQRLQILESKAIKKEKKKQADDEKMEKLNLREKRLEKKRKQRLEIYALNKLMTEYENKRFHVFMSQAGSNI